MVPERHHPSAKDVPVEIIIQLFQADGFSVGFGDSSTVASSYETRPGAIVEANCSTQVENPKCYLFATLLWGVLRNPDILPSSSIPSSCT